MPAAWHALMRWPDLILFDGREIARPRGFGPAPLFGLWLKAAPIGVARRRPVGIGAALQATPRRRRSSMSRIPHLS